MISNRRIHGMEIVNFKGRTVGKAQFAYWSLKNTCIDGIVALKSDFLQVRFYLPFSSIEKIDRKIILIKNYRPRKRETPKRDVAVICGKDRGYMSDFCFDENNGRVIQVEMAKNIYEDVRHGRIRYTDFTISDGSIHITQEG